MSYFCEDAMPLTVKERIQARIDASADKAFVRREFADMGAYRQVSRALAALVAEGKLIRAGMGVWVLAERRPSRTSGREGQEETLPLTDVIDAALTALPKLGYDVRRNSLEAPIVKVAGRTRRKLAVSGQELQYDSARPRNQMKVVASSHERLDRRSLAMHRLIADKIRAEPRLSKIASENIERWLRTSRRNDRLLNTWSELLQQGISAALAVATEDSERARELRQSTPFAGVLSPQERWSFLKTWNETNWNM